MKQVASEVGHCKIHRTPCGVIPPNGKLAWNGSQPAPKGDLASRVDLLNPGEILLVDARDVDIRAH
eukprot:CAMPEP_0117660544 /NCGR_PEP_ID=MMETSP0804-20121206/7025_1 /TAXON_ID=1074897 /ORGANISM="Tetraselmis astigmatica, Strain CCMP880" /LENGTH=65 /DNA_ID=CAMNT_0005467281 /DNA_START=92 /DNA_END=290 /DNA_ORIENTATION=-